MATHESEKMRRLREHLVAVAREGGICSYEDVAAATGIRIGRKPGELFPLLTELQGRKAELGCDLSSLVIRRTTGMPGSGWGDKAEWEAEVAVCHRYYGGPEALDLTASAPPEASPAEGADVLPYDPGNAGDLLKHSWLAATVRWLLQRDMAVFDYADPFAGEWEYDPAPGVRKRLPLLRGTALALYSHDAWRRGRYLGSTGLVGSIGEHEGREIRIWVGDRCEERVRRLIDRRACRSLAEPSDGYAVLESAGSYSLILLDPFSDFLDQAEQVLPRIVARAWKSSVLLSVLSASHDSAGHERYRSALQELCQGEHLTAIMGGLPALPDSDIRGEANHAAEVVLMARRDLSVAAVNELLPALGAATARCAGAAGVGTEATLSLIGHAGSAYSFDQ